MRSRKIASLAVLAAALAASACAARRGVEPLDPDPRDWGALVHPDAEAIPLFSSHRVPGCSYRPAGELAGGSLSELRDGAHQKMASAVVDVRRHVSPVPRTRSTSPAGNVRPAVVEYYTGLAVHFLDGCQAV
jgi:hypothetical protein